VLYNTARIWKTIMEDAAKKYRRASERKKLQGWNVDDRFDSEKLIVRIRVTFAAEERSIDPVVAQVCESLTGAGWSSDEFDTSRTALWKMLENAVVLGCKKDPLKTVQLLVGYDDTGRTFLDVQSEGALGIGRQFVEWRPASQKHSLLTKAQVEVVDFSPQLLATLQSDPTKLYRLSPDQLEMFVCDRLTAMGLRVRRIGAVNSPDGGLDLIAVPKEDVPVPYLIGVQVKHHENSSTKVGPAEVRELHGVLLGRHVQIGMLVTNTSFTPTALWEATHGNQIIRLRDFSDLQRWLLDNFVDGTEWREIPQYIEFAPGKRILIPRSRG
jgi:hypothetical protein